MGVTLNPCGSEMTLTPDPTPPSDLSVIMPSDQAGDGGRRGRSASRILYDMEMTRQAGESAAANESLLVAPVVVGRASRCLLLLPWNPSCCASVVSLVWDAFQNCLSY